MQKPSASKHRNIGRLGITLASILLLTGCGDVSLPPIFGGAAAKTESSTTTPTLASPVVSNNKNLFGKSLKTDNERLNRLERSVQSLRNDFDTIQPSIRRLMAVESDIQELIGELKQLSDDPNRMRPAMTPVVEEAMVTRAPVKNTYVPPKKKMASNPKSYQKKSAPPVEGGMTTVFDVRSGEYTNRTRLVLDANAKTSYNIDIDNNENILVVDLANTNWTAATSKSFPKSSVISSYNVEASDNGNLMVIQLKKDVKISYKATLPANKGNGKRIVLDIAGL